MEKAYSTTQEAMIKDAERAFCVMVLRWAFLARSCTSIDRGLSAKPIPAAIILHNMIVKVRRDDYENELWKLAQDAIDPVYFVDENCENKEFKWNTQWEVLHGSIDPSGTHWATHVGLVDSRTKNSIVHHALKLYFGWSHLGYAWLCWLFRNPLGNACRKNGQRDKRSCSTLRAKVELDWSHLGYTRIQRLNTFV